jgi:AcrR family transcriptional regulator
MRPYDERLDALLAAAARVFAERSYHATSMRDLAAASGVSLAGIYYYVKGKEELLHLIQERCFTQVLEGAKAAVAAEADPNTRLQAFIRHHVAFFAAHMAEMKVLSHEANSLTGEGHARVNTIKRRYVDVLEKLLKDASPDERAVDRSAAAYALFGMMNWIYNWYDPRGKLSVSQLVDNITRLFLSGFLSRANESLALADSGRAEKVSVWRTA